jgi:hypothetical protein
MENTNEVNNYHFPDWVPDAVQQVAIIAGIPVAGDDDFRRRLIVDPRMKPVWKWLAKTGRIGTGPWLASRLDALPPRLRLEAWEVLDIGVSVRDQLCAAFYISTLDIIGIRAKPDRKNDALKYADELQRAAVLCQNVMPAEPIAEKVRILSEAGKILEECSTDVREKVYANNPFILNHSSGPRNDDKVRVMVRALL